MKSKSIVITQDSPLQLSVSLAFPAHGIPPEKVLALLLDPVLSLEEVFRQTFNLQVFADGVLCHFLF